MKIIQAPQPLPESPVDLYMPMVLMLGTYDGNDAWRDHLSAALADEQGTILDPTNDDAAVWAVQDASNPLFVKQVAWEVKAIEMATYIAMHLEGTPQGVISLFELGRILVGATGPVHLSADVGFWKRGYVVEVAKHYNVHVHETSNGMLGALYYNLQCDQGDDFLRSRPDLLDLT